MTKYYQGCASDKLPIEHKFKKCYKCNTTCSDRDTMETHMKEHHTDPSCETELDISLDEERLALLQIEMEKEGVQ